MSASRAAAARWLFDEHTAGRTFAPLSFPPDVERIGYAYDVQDRFVELLAEASATRPAGYKIGLTTARMQQMCGLDHPLAGVVLANRIHRGPVIVNFFDAVHLGIECELAVQLARALPEPVEALTRPKIGECVAAVAAAFELVDDRHADYRSLDIAALIADNAWNHAIVLGTPIELDELGALEGELYVDGKLTDRGSSRDVLGHPLAAVEWLATHLAKRGRALAAGDWIMTGSVVPTRFPNRGEHLEFRLGPLAPVSVTVV